MYEASFLVKNLDAPILLSAENRKIFLEIVKKTLCSNILKKKEEIWPLYLCKCLRQSSRSAVFTSRQKWFSSSLSLYYIICTSLLFWHFGDLTVPSNWVYISFIWHEAFAYDIVITTYNLGHGRHLLLFYPHRGIILQ